MLIEGNITPRWQYLIAGLRVDFTAVLNPILRKKKAKSSFSADPTIYDEAERRVKARFGIGIGALIRGLLRAFAEGKLDFLFENNPDLLNNEKKRAPGAGRPRKKQDSS